MDDRPHRRDGSEHPAFRQETSADPAGGSLDPLGDFVVSMIQAFLRTGYYLPDHPESKKSKEGLHEKFRTLTKDSQEVTFIMRRDGGEPTVFIEGLADNSVQLKDLMARGMADTYNPRFVGFLERKNLVSLSLSQKMDTREFSAFIDLMSEPSMADMSDPTARVTFADQLKARRIAHVSFVFNEDFITARENIPWRAALAISRLRKDIFSVPIYRNLSKEEAKQVRHETLSEILRPLQEPELVYAFIMNIDLAAMKTLSEEEAEDIFFAVSKAEVLVGIAPLFTDDASGKTPLYLEGLPPRKAGRILQKFTKYLTAIGTEEAFDGIETMFNAGLMPPEALPPELMERVQTARRVERFIAEGGSILTKLDQVADPRSYASGATSLVKVYELLLTKKKVEEAFSIVAAFDRHRKEDSPRADTARAIVSTGLTAPAVMAQVGRLFLSEPKEVRVMLGKIFEIAGKAAVNPLLAVLGDTEDTWRRKQATEIIFRTGRTGVEALLERMKDGSMPLDTLSTVVRVLGDCEDKKILPAVIEAVAGRTADADGDVRAEAYASLGRLDPRGHYDTILKGLSDSDLAVKRQAARGIGFSGETRAADALSRLIPEDGKAESDEEWALAATALDALGRLAQSGGEGRAKASDTILALAEKAAPKGTFKRLLGRSPWPTNFLTALATALGHLDDDESLQALERLSESKETPVARRAKDALKRRQSG